MDVHLKDPETTKISIVCQSATAAVGLYSVRFRSLKSSIATLGLQDRTRTELIPPGK